MATTKETMNVIAGGLDENKAPATIMDGKVIAVEVPDELAGAFEGLIESLISGCEKAEAGSQEDAVKDDEEMTMAEELAADIVFWLADRASDNMLKMARENALSTETMLEIVKCLQKTGPKSLIAILKTVFLSHEMVDAAGELYLLSICADYLEDTAALFKDVFFDTDAMDWYSVENLLRDKNREQNSKLN